MSRPLGFSDVDGLGFAAERGRLSRYDGRLNLSARDLGPFLEYALLGAEDIVPRPGQASWLKLDGLETLYSALQSGVEKWVCPATGYKGVFRTQACVPDDDVPWTAFQFAAQKAATGNCFPKQTAAQLAAALGELHSNIYEHSNAPHSGVIAFAASEGCFEFTVADWGIGVLESLRGCEEFAGLSDHGHALELALTDGVSRFGKGDGRGHGFHDLFTGLANLNGSLRFRSGDAALTIEGRNPGKMPWVLAEKIPIKGFFASIACRPF